jgi:hypothetical protein
MLQQIKMVTYSVADLSIHVRAWQQYLQYQEIHRGTISRELAMLWQAPGVAGAQYALLQPASQDAVWLRFIETGHDLPFKYPLYQGWNATELLVADADELAARFRNSPFTVIGGPHNLYHGKKSPRAIQVLGPAGELLYFSRLLPGGSRYGLKGAKSFVDRTFNVIAGGINLESMGQFYNEQLSLRIYDPIHFTIPMLAEVCGVPANTPFSLQIAKIAGRRFIVELDEYPPGVTARPVAPGMIPPGMSMVSFIVSSLNDLPVHWRASPAAISDFGYAGQRAAVTQGAAGEWIEIIEAAAPSAVRGPSVAPGTE